MKISSLKIGWSKPDMYRMLNTQPKVDTAYSVADQVLRMLRYHRQIHLWFSSTNNWQCLEYSQECAMENWRQLEILRQVATWGNVESREFNWKAVGSGTISNRSKGRYFCMHQFIVKVLLFLGKIDVSGIGKAWLVAFWTLQELRWQLLAQ